MNEILHPALLPLGLSDLLPPDAGVEARVVAAMMAVLESHGYERVKPPLMEFTIVPCSTRSASKSSCWRSYCTRIDRSRALSRLAR